MQYRSLLGVTLGVALGLGAQEAGAVSEVKTGMRKPDAPGWSVVTLEPEMAAAVSPTSEAISPSPDPVAALSVNDADTDWVDHPPQTSEPEAFASDAVELPAAPPQVERPDLHRRTLRRITERLGLSSAAKLG